MNKKVLKNKGGRPPKYDTEEKLNARIVSYFKKCLQKKRATPVSKAGLRVHLDISREVYSDYKRKFPDAIKKAENIVERYWVERLSSPGATGAIFYLKNAFRDDYKEKQEVEHSGKLDISKVLDDLEKEK